MSLVHFKKNIMIKVKTLKIKYSNLIILVKVKLLNSRSYKI